MRIRRDSAFISSVLFTIALLWLVPECWSNALAGGLDVYFRPAPNGPLQQMDSGSRALAQTLGQLGSGVGLGVPHFIYAAIDL